MQAYAEILNYQNTSSDVALFDTVRGEQNAFVHSVRPFPHHLLPAYQPVMPWPSVKQKIDRDFILVCEFSEIIGPTPLITIPPNGGRHFDKEAFAVKIMAVDYNATNTMRCYASFTIAEDTSVIIEDKEENIYAYVHYFTLYDIHARGYVRPFCMAYVTPDRNKLFTFLEKLISKFKSVSQLFRMGNQLLFQTDLDQRLADLLYTKESVQPFISPKPKETTTSSRECNEGTDGAVARSNHCRSSNHQESLNRSIQDCQDMLEELRKKMENSSFIAKYQKQESHSRISCNECSVESGGYYSDSETMASTESQRNICNSTLSKSLSSLCKVPQCQCSREPYQPKFVRVDAFRRYDQTLRNLQKLCGKLGHDALGRLQKLYKIFSRDAAVLKLEQTESGLVNPTSTLLTIGRTVQINFLANLSVQSSNSEGTYRYRHNPRQARTPLVGTPSSTFSIFSDASQKSFPLSYDAEFVPGSTAASLDSIYYDVEEGLDEGDEEKTTQDDDEEEEEDDDTWLDISVTSGEQTSSDETRNSRSQSFDVVSINSYSYSETENGDVLASQLLSSQTIPLVNGYDKGIGLSRLTSLTEPVVSRCSKVPVGCYASRLNSTNMDLPGADLKAFLFHYSFSIHLIYALLSGRTTIITASPKFEKEVYSIIRTLRLFVPGHSSNQLIVPWHTKPLTMFDLGRMKLVGLAKPRSLYRVIPASVFRFSTVFEYDSSKLWTPPYEGTILKKTLAQCKQLHYNQSCIAAVETMMLKYSTKAFLFYHTYCLNTRLCPNQSETGKRPAAADFLSKINVTQGDAKIVQYWVEIIKQQQISESISQNHKATSNKMPIILSYAGSKLYHN